LSPDKEVFSMVSVFDVVAYILECMGKITAMKLQKLVYYCQAWSLVWDEQPLFSERIDAWANGPVVLELYNKHRGMFEVNSRNFSHGDAQKLNPTQKETVNAVLDYYGDKVPIWFSDLTHKEDPWHEAQRGLACGKRGSREITLSSMEEYYSSLLDEED